MAARTKARKRALDVLYESEMRGPRLDATLADRIASGDPPVNEFTVSLVEGVVANQERIDELIGTYSVGWTLNRMPAVDRNLLRIAVFEIIFGDEVPDAVAVSEAVHLAGDLSTGQSPTFVNGLLGRLVEQKPTLTV